ncbi:MAG: hypothetical protein GAK30_00240 [Paracidovorax wautersii]|uniref:DUF218 domain-containing protein n=1 Tax=Paracidovorax wautersii TaxID=1177982 RepID=A0A7V8JS54_9BURK|nr:MAG: hypothetical protein GAK30_00240 [Paracidovorax wautersii]
MKPPTLGRPWPAVALGLVGALLLVDSAVLLAQHQVNFGTILPGLLGVAAGLLAWHWPALRRWRAPPAPRWRRVLWRTSWGVFALWLLSLLVFFAFIRADHSTSPDQAPAAIVVLGSGTPRCQPSATLSARLDEALQQARHWPQAVVVVSGGPDRWLDCTEADVMADYLLQQGLPEARLLRESRSTSTFENLRWSRELLASRGQAAEPLLLVTSDFHALRARLIARRAGFIDVASATAPTPLPVRYNAWLREYFAFASGWMLGEY